MISKLSLAEKPKKRIATLDLVRVVAIILVILTHAREVAGPYEHNELFNIIGYSIDRNGVPLFFFLTGALVLTKAHTFPILSFYKKRIPQYLLCLFVYSFLTNAVYQFTLGNKSLADAVLAGLHTNGFVGANIGVAHQLWFMYLIIGIYLIIPFLARLLNQLTFHQILIFLALALFSGAFQLSFPNATTPFIGRLEKNLLGEVLPYFIFGYLIQRFNVRIKTSGGAILITAISIPTLISFDFFEIICGYRPEWHWYHTSIPIMITSSCLFVLIISLSIQSLPKIYENISRFSFGMFLTHFIFLYLAKYFWFSVLALGNHPVRGAVFLFCFSFLCSYATVKFVSKIPFIKKLVI